MPIGDSSPLALVGQLGVPALVAVVVTYLANRRLETRRGHREFNTRTLDAARSDVRRFGTEAALYWSRDAQEDDLKLETELIILQEDILQTVAEVLDLSLPQYRANIETALDELIRLGTGGNFQVADRKADARRAKTIPGAAASLRTALLRARRGLLEKKGM